ncbi:MAG: V-type ATP synthase subunit D [Candidatus Marsarchaeota archaeon]|jgi:V/A-type H+-transporting ATPase subunit D|nr:V-type ATP synthase subunit D [Candidatus Marsarchaeota archaeon]MCL5419013.1 V-type ATP synthase subunit D [Candidatus Marsarchaeota archaeon]
MESVKTTRMELIKIKSRIRVAGKGLNLLKLKRSSLVLEFFNLARQIELLKGSMEKSVEKAYESTKVAEIAAGKIALERIAAEQSKIGTSVTAKNVMGVKIPSISVSMGSLSAAYELISVPAAIYDAQLSYSQLFKMLIEIAEKENSLRKLLYEIEKLNRRVNALENVTMPRLIGSAAYIKQRLDDMERDQIVSLKFVKGKLNEQGE